MHRRALVATLAASPAAVLGARPSPAQEAAAAGGPTGDPGAPVPGG